MFFLVRVTKLVNLVKGKTGTGQITSADIGHIANRSDQLKKPAITFVGPKQENFSDLVKEEEYIQTIKLVEI